MALVAMTFDGPSINITKGRDYVNWRFQFSDEILLDVEYHGKVLLAKLPDGRLQATSKQSTIDLFTVIQKDIVYGAGAKLKH